MITSILNPLYNKQYPDAKCSLTYNEPYELLIATRLSAQCTDERVNIVCRELFSEFPTAKSIADAPIERLEEIIKPCGLYKMKASSVKASMNRLLNEYGGVIPNSMDELLKFEGVGRKIANLLLGDLYSMPAIVADTHCMRICGRFGMYRHDLRDPYKVEMQLRKILPPNEGNDFCHRLVLFGRDICSARAPKCGECPLSDLCPHGERKA